MGKTTSFHNNEQIWQRSGESEWKLEPETPGAHPPKQSRKNTAYKAPSKVRRKAPTCPECDSKQAWKDGLRGTRVGNVQRWLCRSCGYRFSEDSGQNQIKVNVPPKQSKSLHPALDLHNSYVVLRNLSIDETSQNLTLTVTEKLGVHNLTKLGKQLNSLPYKTSKRQVCDCEAEASKNLEENATRQETAAGATTDNKSQLFQYSWWLKKEGYAEVTIETRTKLLKILTKRGADLSNPESVKETIARQEWCNKRKLNACDAYTVFLRMTNGTWNPPRYQTTEKLPFIPTEAEIDALIAGCGPKTSTFLQLLKETGMRSGEAHRLQWIDIDFEKGTVRVTPEKGSRPRIFKLSNKLMSMLNALKWRTDLNRVFSKHLRTQRRLFQKQRANIARKLQNPRLLQIHFHTFRHWKATMEYAKTKDILHVMNILGHKSIKNTMMYTQLINFETDDYTAKVAHSLSEDKELIEAGFEYVTERDGFKIYRKRK